jgi:hypothetical protein
VRCLALHVIAYNLIRLGNLLPELPRRPSQRQAALILAAHVRPAALSAARALQLLKPFLAQNQHRIGLNHQASPLA